MRDLQTEAKSIKGTIHPRKAKSNVNNHHVTHPEHVMIEFPVM